MTQNLLKLKKRLILLNAENSNKIKHLFVENELKKLKISDSVFLKTKVILKKMVGKIV